MRHVPSSLVISAVVAGALLVHLCIGSLTGPRCKMRISLWSCYYYTERVKCKIYLGSLNILLCSMFFILRVQVTCIYLCTTFASTFYLFFLHDEGCVLKGQSNLKGLMQ
jgi:hypothetical protein